MVEFEHDINGERARSGLTAVRSCGRINGRPKELSKAAEHKAIIAEQLYKDGELSISEICRQLSISKSTYYNYLKHRGVEAR